MVGLLVLPACAVLPAGQLKRHRTDQRWVPLRSPLNLPTQRLVRCSYQRLPGWAIPRGVADNGVDNAAAVDTGNGGSSGGGDNNGNGRGGGGGGGGGGGSSGGGPPSSSSTVWGLLAIAVAAASAFAVRQRNLKAAAQKLTPPAPVSMSGEAESEDVVLRRLVQEAFADLVKVRARLDELEDVTGISTAAASDEEATPLDGGEGEGGGRAKGQGRAKGPAVASSAAGSGGRVGKHHLGVLSGNLELGGGLLWAPDESNVGELLPAAGVKLGADLTLRMRGLARGGKDSLQAECKFNQASDQYVLKKVLYYCQLSPALRLALAPFGATMQDTAYTLNPLAGQGLTSMIKHGSPLHQRPLGSLVGASWDYKKTWASAGYAMQGSEWGVRSALFGQVLHAPSSTLSLGLTATHQQAAPVSTPRASPSSSPSRGFYPSPRGAASPGAGAPAPSYDAGAPWRQLGAMFAWRPDDDVVVHGWVATDPEALRRGVRRRGVRGLQPEQWGLSLGSYPDGTGNGWAVGLGRSAAVVGAGGGGDYGGAPNLFELSLQFSAGEGMVVSPGVMCAVQSGRTTLFAGLKTSWDW